MLASTSSYLAGENSGAGEGVLAGCGGGGGGGGWGGRDAHHRGSRPFIDTSARSGEVLLQFNGVN